MKLQYLVNNIKYFLIVILLLCLVLIPASVAYAAPQKYEEYTAGTGVFTTCSDRWRAQTFTAIETHTVTSVKVQLQGHGIIPETILSIRATDYLGKPTGTDLVSASKNTFTNGWVEFIFPTPIIVNKGEMYAIIVRAPSANPGVDYVTWFYCYSGTLYDGGQFYQSYSDGDYWDGFDCCDMRFEVWGEPFSLAVGGEAYPVGKISLLAPWLALAVVIAAGGVYLVIRRVHS
jgi:hypothetical protein